MKINRVKKLIMEAVPYEPGRQTTYLSLYDDVTSYSSELGFNITKIDFRQAITLLHEEQCIYHFDDSDIRPTQHGLVKYT